MSIKIWSPKELPFGALSNNTVYLMNIDNKTYNTVTNFVYSNLISSKEYFDVLKNMNTQDIYSYFNKYDSETVNKLIKESLRVATYEKFKNKSNEDILLSTEDFPILYVDNDSILGSGKNGKGQNLLGKNLMEIRDGLRVKKSMIEKQLYDAYTALQILETLINKENNDLTSFRGLTPLEILNKYIQLKAAERVQKQTSLKKDLSEYPIDDLTKMTPAQIVEKYKYIVDLPDKNVIQTLNTGENIKILQLVEASIKRPHLLMLYVKKKYYSKLRSVQLARMTNDIFNAYVDNIIATRYPDLPKNKYQEAKNKEFDAYVDSIIASRYPNLPKNQYEEAKNKEFDLTFEWDVMKDQILQFYKQNLLSPEVMTVIGKTVNVNIISEKVVKDVEQIDIDYMIYSSLEKKENIVITFKNNSTYDETPYYIFSPFVNTGMLVINGLNYPTIMHYIIANLFSLLPEIGSLQKAHKYLLYNPDGDVNDNLNYDQYEYLFFKYEDEKYHQYNRLRKKLTTIALNKKFEDIGLQELLLATGNNKLIWDDPYDDILGVAFSGKGEDFVGKYLVELREKFKITNTFDNITDKDVVRIMENDIFMKSWLEMRLTDICKVTKEVKRYLFNKYNKDIEITVEFIIDVLNNIYQPCHDILRDFDNKTEPPQYFQDLVRKCFGFRNTTPSMITLLWNRIIILIHFVLKNVTPNLKNIKTVLAKTEILFSAKTQCVEIINNETDNCIISAIINIVKKLSDFNIANGNDPIVSKYDIETAVNIILNKYKQQIEDRKTTPDFSSFIKQNIDKSLDVLNVGDYDVEFDDQKFVDSLSDYEDDDEDKVQVEYIVEDEPEIEFEYVVEDDNGNDSGDKRRRRVFRSRPLADKDRWSRIQMEIDMEIERKERERFEKYKNINKLIIYLDANNIKSTNNTVIAEFIMDAVSIIHKYKMSEKIKRNRINFFATTL